MSITILSEQIKPNQIKPKPNQSNYIADMGALQQTSANFVSQAISWPTNLSGYLQDGVLCCMLHVSVELGVGDMKGCAGWKPGTHKSVQALYGGAGVPGRCFANPGQLVLDRRVALQARDMTIPGCAAIGDGIVMSRKYRSGLPIGVSAYGAGYCYLAAFPVGVRSRVARILGPLPYIADVLRLMRVLGDMYVSADWIKLADGLYHVVPIRDPNVPARKFFLDGWSIMQSGSVEARVGVQLDEPNIVVKSLGFLVDYASTIVGCVRGRVECDEDETEWLLHRDDVITTPLGLDHADVNAKGKIKCMDCYYYVNPDGHALRCLRKVHVDADEYDTFAAAWMGDVVHRRDVRFYCLMRKDIPKEGKGKLEESYVKREAQAAYYLNYTGKKVPAHGTSFKAISTAFEASYSGQFRSDYIMSVFGHLSVGDLPKYLQPFAGAL